MKVAIVFFQDKLVGYIIGMLLRTPTIHLLPTSATGVVSLVIIQVYVKHVSLYTL